MQCSPEPRGVSVERLPPPKERPRVAQKMNFPESPKDDVLDPRRMTLLPLRFGIVVQRAHAYLRHSRRRSRISRGRERLQLRRWCALAREVLQCHQGLHAHARVIVVEQFAQPVPLTLFQGVAAQGVPGARLPDCGRRRSHRASPRPRRGDRRRRIATRIWWTPSGMSAVAAV